MIINLHKTLRTQQKEQLLQIWNEEYPTPILMPSIEAFEVALAKFKEPLYFFASDENQQLMGWLVLFQREGGTWFVMMVNRQFQGKGVGSRLLDEAKKQQPSIYGWVIPHNRYQKSDGRIYHSPLAFYRKNDFQVFPHIHGVGSDIDVVKVQWERSATVQSQA